MDETMNSEEFNSELIGDKPVGFFQIALEQFNLVLLKNFDWVVEWRIWICELYITNLALSGYNWWGGGGERGLGAEAAWVQNL